MTIRKFTELHNRSMRLMLSYFAEAEKTCSMLSKCSPEPLPFFKRFAILRQEIAENNAQQFSIVIKEAPARCSAAWIRSYIKVSAPCHTSEAY
jgi:hypothetical protein